MLKNEPTCCFYNNQNRNKASFSNKINIKQFFPTVSSLCVCVYVRYVVPCVFLWHKPIYLFSDGRSVKRR